MLMEIAPHEMNILASFVTYPLLSVEEVCTLHYQAGSASYVNKLLSGLVKKKLLVRPPRPHVSKPYFYYLSRRGVKFLTNNGLTATFTPYAYPSQIEHLQTTTALMMAIEKLPHSYPQFDLIDLKHDLTLKRELSGMIPDVLTTVHKGSSHALLWWEVEIRKDQKQFRENKIRKLIRFLNREYSGAYGEQLPTILLLTPVGQHKADVLKRWLEAELESTYEKDKAYLFRITCVPKEKFDPAILFFEKIWRIPFQEDSVWLFDR